VSRIIITTLIAALIAAASPARALAVGYDVDIMGAGTVTDQLDVKRENCSSPITTPQGVVGNACARVDYPNAWGITFTATPADGWQFAGWQGSTLGNPKISPLNCTGADESHWLAGNTKCAFATDVFGNPTYGVEARFVDVRDPRAEITSGPPARVGPTTPVRWVFDEPQQYFEGSHFYCNLDNAGFKPCTSPVDETGASPGGHTFAVEPQDPSGRTGQAVSGSWFVDNQPPETSIASGPPAVTTATTATFSYSQTHETGDTDGTFQCRLDGGQWDACGSGASGTSTRTVGEGSHVFAVRAIDPFGNTDQTPAQWSWTVDTGPPVTRIVSGPAEGATTAATTATFGFTSENGATFQCSLDGGPFAACSGPGNVHTVSGLSDGAHTFAVRATDAVGNQEHGAPTRSWIVDTTPPDTVVTAGPAPGATVYATDVRFAFASEPGATFLCRLDGAAPARCNGVGQQTYSGLALGVHTFQVQAADAVGNLDPSPAIRTFTVSDATVAITHAAIAAKWRHSRLTAGTLALTGTLAGPGAGRLRIAVAGASMAVRVSTGAFALHLALPPKLRARLVPGVAVLTLDGMSGAMPIVATTVRVRVPAPPEGVVTRAEIGAGRHGPLKLITSARELWAKFSFAPAATPRRPIRAYWFRNGKPLGHYRAAAPHAFTWYQRPAGLPAGTYRCALMMGRTLIASVSIRVG
jgi:hypothetical protein